MHGEDYVALGFLFGQKSKVAYISDVSHFIPATEAGECLLWLTLEFGNFGWPLWPIWLLEKKV